jgi:hypothetical protein
MQAQLNDSEVESFMSALKLVCLSCTYFIWNHLQIVSSYKGLLWVSLRYHDVSYLTYDRSRRWNFCDALQCSTKER